MLHQSEVPSKEVFPKLIQAYLVEVLAFSSNLTEEIAWALLSLLEEALHNNPSHLKGHLAYRINLGALLCHQANNQILLLPHSVFSSLLNSKIKEATQQMTFSVSSQEEQRKSKINKITLTTLLTGSSDY